jgi:cyclic pyranopterin phosphate synthase
MPAPVLDRLSRPLRDLRVSVTDRCNFRCTYCMPRESFGADHAFLPRSDLLTFEEIERVARATVGLGVRKVRLTGGEPLVRRDLDGLVSRLAAIEGLDDLALTTNGALLPRHAERLARAGLRRVTVSLDSLDDATFRAMNDVGFPVAGVLAGIDAAVAAGLSPVKVNAVVQRGRNDGQVLDLAAWARERGHVLRFIEFMDVGTTNGWRLEDVVPSAELARRIDAKFPIEPMAPTVAGETAERWRYRDGKGEVGFVSSVTRAFCGTCNRARLSADGRLFTCLFATKGTDVRAWLRAGVTDAELSDRLRALWAARGDRYSEERSAATAGLPKVEMSYIGG